MRTGPDIVVDVSGIYRNPDPSLLDGSTQNYHCILSTGGRNWIIMGMSGMGWIRICDGVHEMVVDLSGMDLESYAEKALAMDEASH